VPQHKGEPVSEEQTIDVPAVQPEPLNGMPVLPLRDVVVYPHMVIPLFVGREKSIVALDRAMKADKRILLVAQKQADVDDPKAKICIGRHGRDDPAAAQAARRHRQGAGRGRRSRQHRAAGRRRVLSRASHDLPDVERYEEREMDVLTRSVITQFEQYVKLNKKGAAEILTSLAGIEQAGRLADTVAAHMSLKLSEKQKVLEIPTCASVSSTCSRSSKARWMCCRSKSAFAAASSSRWRRASASTT
jgi:ATP-dependent Lon protease